MIDAFSQKREERFCGSPHLADKDNQSWVVNATEDLSVHKGELYAFKDNAHPTQVINKAVIELDKIIFDNYRSALDVFNEYFRFFGQEVKEPFRTFSTALMLYTDDRFFKVFNNVWRNNRSRQLLGFSTLLIQAFEHAPYYTSGEVYRGVNLTDVANYKPGLKFRWPFVVSASTKKMVAQTFGKTLFSIEVPASANVRDIQSCSVYPDEGEVLFHPYEIFEVIGASPKEVRVRVSDDLFHGIPGVEWDKETGEVKMRQETSPVKIAKVIGFSCRCGTKRKWINQIQNILGLLVRSHKSDRKEHSPCIANIACDQCGMIFSEQIYPHTSIKLACPNCGESSLLKHR